MVMTRVVVIGTAGSILDRLLRGTMRYRDLHDLDWQVSEIPSKELWRLPAEVGRPGDRLALVGMLDTASLGRHRQLLEGRSPIVVSTRSAPGPGVWSVHPDPATIAEQALAHLRDRGYRQVATWGTWSRPARQERFEALAVACRAVGMPLIAVALDHDERGPLAAEVDLMTQVRALPVATAFIAHQDADAAHLRTFLRRCGRRVPQEIGILGVDDQLEYTTVARPTLSSVVVPWTLIGERMAALYHRILNGSEVPPRLQAVPCFGVRGRESTDLGSAPGRSDELVARFLKTLRRVAFRPCSIAALAERLATSPATLRRRVSTATGRSPERHLHDLRVARAADLLSGTALSLPEIARRCGYQSPQSLHRAFTARYPVAPGRWRCA